MRALYIDTVSGISGDMLLAAFVDSGTPLEAVTAELQKLPLNGCRITASRVGRNSVSATRIEIETNNSDNITESSASLSNGNGSLPEHGLEGGGAAAHEHRGYLEILGMIDRAGLAPGTAARAVAVFRRIGEAEAKIHGRTLDEVRFHEIGAADSILDISGIAVCMEIEGIERVYSGAVPVGSGGLVHTRHGLLPVPAPATLEILRGYPIRFADVPEEIVTPTGAAVLAALSRGLPPADVEFLPERIGYGAGSKVVPGLPNFLRIVIGNI